MKFIKDTDSLLRAATATPVPGPPALLPRIGPLLYTQLGRYTLGTLALAGTNGLGLALPWLLARAVDALATPSPGAQAAVVQSALCMLALSAVQAAMRTASRILIFNAAREIEHRLLAEVFSAMLAIAPTARAHWSTGEWLSRLTNDISAVRMLLGPGLLNLANTLIVYATGLTLLMSINARLTLFAVLPLPVVIALGRLSSRRIYRASLDLQAHMGNLAAHLQEDLSGIATLRAYTLKPLRARRFAALNRGYLDRALALVRVRGILGPLFATVGGVGTLVVLWLGGREVVAGRLSLGQLVAFNAYLAYLAWPTLALGWVLSLWQRGRAGWARLCEVLNAPRWHDPPHAALPGAAPVIEARGLTIQRAGRTVLEDVSFRLEPNRTIAIVGPTGAGKSTLCDALLRLCDVPRGQLFVDGVDILDVQLKALRERAAYAPQDPFLFSATLDENIAFGRRGESDDPGDDQIRQAGRAERRAAAHAAGLERDLRELPDGMDTLVGERGINLSGGQRQRVALARALYADARLLILDDALSSVDVETECSIVAQLGPLMRGRATVLVSHRVAAVHRAHEILVLEGGRVVERGTHESLTARAGRYAQLYREQILGGAG